MNWDSAGWPRHCRQRMSAEFLHCNVCLGWKADISEPTYPSTFTLANFGFDAPEIALSPLARTPTTNDWGMDAEVCWKAT